MVAFYLIPTRSVALNPSVHAIATLFGESRFWRYAFIGDVFFCLQVGSSAKG